MPAPPLDLVPVGLRVTGRRVVIVGAGPIAARKAAPYIEAGAVVTVVAPHHDPAMERLPVAERVRRRFEPSDLDGAWLAVTATGDPAVDGAVFDEAERRRVWCNAADDPANCSVVLPAVSRRGPITIAVSTGGTSPAIASWLRRRVDRLLDDTTIEVASIASRVRAAIRAEGLPTEVGAWAEILDGPALGLVAAGRAHELERALHERVATEARRRRRREIAGRR